MADEVEGVLRRIQLDGRERLVIAWPDGQTFTDIEDWLWYRTGRVIHIQLDEKTTGKED
jgi:hypothetical protein